MRINSGLRNSGPRLSSSSGSVAEMHKSEVVADLFNHQPLDNDEDRLGARVHLSYASKLLNMEFQQEVQDFLADHREIAAEVDKIVVLEEGGHCKDLTLRKLRSYLVWCEIHHEVSQEEGGKVPESERPYHAIRSLDRDQEIQGLYKENGKKRALIQENRKKHLPSYYYMVYPETYSFN